MAAVSIVLTNLLGKIRINISSGGLDLSSDGFHFKINTTTYVAEPDMTWQEWVNSDYNQINEYGVKFAIGGTVVMASGQGIYVWDGTNVCSPTDKIRKNATYSAHGV